MSLKEIFCQEKAISILQRAFACEKMPHSYIFAGTEGIGKFKTASQWGKLLLCENPVIEGKLSDSCSRCESCKLFEADSHPDFNPVYKELIQFTKDGKGKKTPVFLPINVIREFLIDKVSTGPKLSKRKVFVVNEAEKLNAAAQNALLKVLEEPPGYCYIILICTRMEKLLPTTKSRCQTIRFSSIDEDRIIEKLQQMGIEKVQGQYFARLAQGSLGQSCQWARLQLADADLYQVKTEIVDSLVRFQYCDSLELAQMLLERSKNIAAIWAKLETDVSKTDINRRVQKTLIQIIISALHDVIKLHISPDNALTNLDQPEQIRKLAENFDIETASQSITDCYKMAQWIEAAVNERLIFERLLISLAIYGRMPAG